MKLNNVKMSETPNSDGTYTMDLDFATRKDAANFRRMVREKYGRKRYSQKLGEQFFAEAITAVANGEVEATTDPVNDDQAQLFEVTGSQKSDRAGDMFFGAVIGFLLGASIVGFFNGFFGI